MLLLLLLLMVGNQLATSVPILDVPKYPVNFQSNPAYPAASQSKPAYSFTSQPSPHTRPCYTKITVSHPRSTHTITVTSYTTTYVNLHLTVCQSTDTLPPTSITTAPTSCQVWTRRTSLLYTTTVTVTLSCIPWNTVITPTITVAPPCPPVNTAIETVLIRHASLETLFCLVPVTRTFTVPVINTVTRIVTCPHWILTATQTSVTTSTYFPKCPDYTIQVTFTSSPVVIETPACPRWTSTSRTSITRVVSTIPGSCPTTVLTSTLLITSTVPSFPRFNT